MARFGGWVRSDAATRDGRQRGDAKAVAPGRLTGTVRVAAWSARHARATALAWLAATVGVFVLSLAIGGMRTSNAAGGSASTEAGRASAAMQGGGSSAEELNVVITGVRVRATDPGFRAAVASVLGTLQGVTVQVGSSIEPAVAGLADPYAAPPSEGLVSADLTSVRLVGRLEGSSAARETRAKALVPAIKALQARLPTLEVHAVSDSLLTDQMSEEINRDLDASLLISLPATFLILLLAFGAVVAAGIPLVLATTALLAAFGSVGIFSLLAEPVSPYAGQFIVLIGLAVAIDYSLFVISRFRTERRAGRPKADAIAAASATSGRAVLFSGIAVMISLAALFLLPDPLFQSIAIGTISVIAVSVAGSFLFLPAALAILGDHIDRGRLPWLGGRLPNASRFWTRSVHVVMRHPVAATIAAVAALLALAAPVTGLRLGETAITGFPERIDSVRAVQGLQAHWPQGTLLRLDVVVTNPGDAAAQSGLARLETALPQVPGLSGPVQAVTSEDGTVRTISAVMSGSENDPANWAIVGHVRTDVIPSLFGEASDAVLVGGGAAVSLDQSQLYTDGMVRIAVFVLGLSFLLLLLVFHSIAIPIKALLLNLLATGTAFGAMVLVFQDGVLAGPLGIARADAIQDFVPVFVFTALFGLSMDYEVFILARITEGIDAGLSTHDAVARGIGQTAGTVTSAAAIMVVVFAVFLTLPLPIARELGLGLMVAVLVDATLIRTVLLPATMRLLGEWNWWLPRFLGWLPRIRVEAEALEASVPSVEASVEPGLGRMLPSGTSGGLQ